MSADHVAILDDPGRWGLRVVDGRLHSEGADLTAIAESVGTPAYIYSAAHIEAQFRKLEASVRQKPTLICYAVKANSSRAILELLRRLGAGADIVSGGELARVLAAGFDPSKIVFSGVGKTDEEIDAALRAGVRSINVESTEELERISVRAQALGVEAPISLRINPDVDPKTHPYLATGMQEAKFGIPMASALATALRVVALPGLRLFGLASHIGSQIQDTRPYLDSLARLRVLLSALAERGITLSQLDLGGGHGIAYRPGDPELDVESWGAALAAATADLPMELVLEPGRYLVGNAGVLLTRVLGTKAGEKKRFVIVDAAMNDLIRPALYEAYHVVVPVELAAAQFAEVQTVDVVGPVCESGDFLALGRPMPAVATGDLLAVLSAGAYGAVMAGTYNTRPEPVEVMVSGEQWAVTKARRTIAEIIDAERVPPWMA
ncbi:MAG: diaminopimelate decarboxylase [Nannocystaceae bacterium]|nr:diaminopimelate decarboxylase [Nannocystaceae bacterium]